VNQWVHLGPDKYEEILLLNSNLKKNIGVAIMAEPGKLNEVKKYGDHSITIDRGKSN
jgi:hypothetical protein